MSSWRSGLLEDFRDGDRDALDEVYRMHIGMVMRVVRTLLRRHHALGGRATRAGQPELPDLVQEIFARAFAPSTRRSFDGLRDYQPFLRNIARNVTIDHLRRERVHLPLDRDHAGAGLAAPEPLELEDLRALALLERRVASLPSDLRRVHDAIYVDGLSQRQAAAALGLGRQAVRTCDARLRDVLRCELTARGAA